jgi:hypothetical protein
MATKIISGSKLDLVIAQGATFTKKFQWKDANNAAIDLAGYTARLQIRAETDSTGSPLLEFTTENGRITLNTPESGDVNLKLTAVDTTAISFTTGVYDLELVHTVSGESVVDNIVYGTVSIRKNVTR